MNWTHDGIPLAKCTYCHGALHVSLVVNRHVDAAKVEGRVGWVVQRRAHLQDDATASGIGGKIQLVYVDGLNSVQTYAI